MDRIRRRGLADVLRGLEQPVLGICLGMQLLFESSEEGDVDCLGILPGRVRRLANAKGLRVPHMGWNRVRPKGDCELLKGLGPEEWFYFVHSYAAPPGAYVEASAEYGDELPAVVRSGKVFGVQFHPERSSDPGRRLLENFLKLIS